MPYVRTLSNGTIQIDSVAAFCGVLAAELPAPDLAFTDDGDSVITRLDNAVKAEFAGVNQGALNNVHGNWYEWLLSIAAWNTHVEHETEFVAFTLPNVTGFDSSKLYVPPLHAMIEHLRREVINSAGVSLISSNPDFVIVETDTKAVQLPRPITVITPELITQLDTMYRQFVNQCEFGDIRGYIAAKTSFRPDRRLQIPHEGSLMKALYVHLQTRLWIMEPKELKFYAVTAKPKDADYAALRTVATHSITTVSSKPQSAVDAILPINSMREAETAFLTMLNP